MNVRIFFSYKITIIKKPKYFRYSDSLDCKIWKNFFLQFIVWYQQKRDHVRKETELRL